MATVYKFALLVCQPEYESLERVYQLARSGMEGLEEMPLVFRRKESARLWMVRQSQSGFQEWAIGSVALTETPEGYRLPGGEEGRFLDDLPAGREILADVAAVLGVSVPWSQEEARLAAETAEAAEDFRDFHVRRHGQSGL